MGEVHIDIPIDKMDEFIPENLTNFLVDEAFPDVWKKRKEELKSMSKRDLAEEMFGAGAYTAIQQILCKRKQMDNEDESE